MLTVQQINKVGVLTIWIRRIHILDCQRREKEEEMCLKMERVTMNVFSRWKARAVTTGFNRDELSQLT